jgi:hypothetical protein
MMPCAQWFHHWYKLARHVCFCWDRSSARWHLPSALSFCDAPGCGWRQWVYAWPQRVSNSMLLVRLWALLTTIASFRLNLGASHIQGQDPISVFCPMWITCLCYYIMEHYWELLKEENWGKIIVDAFL